MGDRIITNITTSGTYTTVEATDSSGCLNKVKRAGSATTINGKFTAEIIRKLKKYRRTK